MKKILSLALSLALAISLTLTAMANTYIHYSYMDPESGIVYHYGNFEDGDTDAGLMINGKKYSLKGGIYMGDGANAYTKSSTRTDVLKNQFMIGIKAHDSVSDTYQVIPYAEKESGVITAQPITVYKNAYTAPLLTKSANAITDDIGMNSLSESGVVAETHTIRTDGLMGSNKSWLYITLLKIDLANFKDAAAGSNFILNLYGKMGNPDGVTNLEDLKLEAIGVPDVDWNESNYSEKLERASQWHLNYVKNNPVSDAVVIPVNAKDKALYKLNITGFIQSELAAEKSYATIALFANNDKPTDNAVADDPTTDENEAVRNALNFTYYTKDSSTPPFVEYQYGDTAVELKELYVGGEKIEPQWIDADNTYYKYLPYGTTEFPEVNATANDAASVSIIPATAETNEAVVTITNTYDTTISETYKVKYIVTEYESAATNVNLIRFVTNTYYAQDNVTDNSVKTGVNSIYAADVVGKIQNYVPFMGFVQLDLSELQNCDLSGRIMLNITKGKLNIGEKADRTNNITAEVSLYDMSDDMDWSYTESVDEATGKTIKTYTGDAKDATKSKAVEENISEKTPFASFVSGHLSTLGATNKLQFDITEFVRKCIRDNNLTPTIGTRIELPELADFGYANAYSRANFNIEFDNVYSYIECYKAVQ